jgi:hypothetical protein
MNNLINIEMINAERRKDRIAEANRYRLVKQVKQQNLRHTTPHLRTSFNWLLGSWRGWLLERFFSQKFTELKDLTTN